MNEREGLVFWRKRELRTEAVKQYKPGQMIRYLLKDGKTVKVGTIDHLNRFSVTVKHHHPRESYTSEIVQIERVLGIAYDPTLSSTDRPALELRSEDS
jgi:hypothetical protein